MFSWRVTKYNPEYRDYRGAYLKNEWISYWDIGRIFDGKKLNFEEYLKIENAYIQAILLFMECLRIDTLTITSLEQHDKNPSKKNLSPYDLEVFHAVTNGKVINKEMLISVVRLVLREKMWCKLESQDMYVHFGYDYYMYIASSRSCEDVIKKIEQLGLFVEPFESPYNETEED